MKDLRFFEYFYYLKPDYLPLHLPQFNFFESQESNNITQSTSCYINQFSKIVYGEPVLKWNENNLFEYVYPTAPCFSSIKSNIQFIVECFGLKHLLQVLYLRTITNPLRIYEWLFLPYATVLQYKKKRCVPKTGYDSTPPVASFKISVLIPSKDRYRLLIDLLHQLDAQTYLPSEVIIIDQSTEFQEIPGQWENIHVQQVYFTKGGQASARNKGIQLARYDYILSIDDDCDINSTFIERHIHTFTTYPDADASVGPYYRTAEKKITPHHAWSISHHLPACNSLVKKSLYLDLGGFDMKKDRYYLSDADLYVRAIQKRKKIILNHLATLHHIEPAYGGLKSFSHNHNTNRFRNNFPNPAESSFFLNLLGESWFNVWFLYNCKRIFSKKMSTHRMHQFTHILILFLLPIWQLSFMVKYKKGVYVG